MTTSKNSIARIWHGWTTKENADAFEHVLTNEAVPSIEKNKPEGYQGLQVLRRELGHEVEFTTIMWFDCIDSVKAFAGEEYEKAHIDPAVRPLLVRYDELSAHHSVRHH